MKNNIDIETKAMLKALGYRADSELISTCVNRLRDGDTTWQLYAPDALDPIVSQGLAVKIAKDWNEGKLDFLEWFHVDEKEFAARDPFRITRYDIVAEAEEMAPHKLWNLRHIRDIYKLHTNEKAITILSEYDDLRSLRLEAEVDIKDFEHETGDGKPVLIEIPVGKAMRKFRSLPRYLTMLYEMHYRTEYRDAPESWASRAAEARVEGELGDDERLSIAADDAFRYQAWSGTNRDAWLDSIDRLSKTIPTRRKFREKLLKKFDIGGKD